MAGRSVPFMAWKVFQKFFKLDMKLAQTISFKCYKQKPPLHFHFEGVYLKAALSFLFF